MSTATNGRKTAPGRGRGKPEPLDDIEAARAVWTIARTRKPPPDDLRVRLQHTPEWGDAALVVEELGPQGLDYWLKVMAVRFRSLPDRLRLIAEAIELAKSEPVAEPAASGEPPQFTLGLIDTATFFEEAYRLEWYVRGLLVKDQPCVFGGPQKSLKTSILIDLAISLGSGTPFLGRFPIPEPVPVALISGESGRAVIQANAREVWRHRDRPGTPAVRWGFVLPQLCNAAHLAVVRKEIIDLGLKVVMFDPLYLALLAGNADIDPKDMFQMGPVLADIAAICIDAGATPILAHHFVKRRDDPFGPPDMGELAYAGIGQFMRQWLLTARRERYDPESGVHRLYLAYGGSAGHAGEIHLDIETGQVGDDFAGRKWVVTVASPIESRIAREAEAAAERERRRQQKADDREREREREEIEATARAGELMANEPGRRITVRRLRNLTGWRQEKAERILTLLEQGGYARAAEVEVRSGNRTVFYPGYELITGGGSQL